MKRAAPYVALLIFVGSVYFGYLAAVRIVYQYKQSAWFSSLAKQDARQLREISQTLLGFELSTLLVQSTSSALQNNINSLGKIRSRAPRELWPILDLRLAKDYAMMARLEQQRGDPQAATTHQQSAEALLRSLGWQDVSDEAVTDMADRELHSRVKR